MGKVPAAISQLGIEATKTRENAISGLGALKVVEDEINKDMKILLKAAAPGLFLRESLKQQGKKHLMLLQD